MQATCGEAERRFAMAGGNVHGGASTVTRWHGGDLELGIILYIRP
jgi:hypothetical protein